MCCFTVITPTGDRPMPFQLCCYYMERQSIKPTEWIIVDDGVTPTTPPDLPFVKYIRRINNQPIGEHTLPLQMIEALQHVTTDKIIMFEDDDWYCPDYFEKMLKLFEENPKAQLIGQGQAVYYHVPFRKCFELVNSDRASMCQSAFTSAFIPAIIKICQTIKTPFVDAVMWQSQKGSKHRCERFLLLDTPPMCVGIKGLPGRVCSTTIGHKGIHPKFKPDPHFSRLRDFIGDDVSLYLNVRHVSSRAPKQRSLTVERMRRLKRQSRIRFR